MSVAPPLGRHLLTPTLMMMPEQPYVMGGYGGGRGTGSSFDDEAEDEEEDEEGRRGSMLGFMFGNVDDSGDLDEEYLDQDAKEHLSALAGQLGPSLVDLELSSKAKKVAIPSRPEEQEDYGRKADDAIDFEDIQEQYEGPEVQMLPQEEQFYARAAVAAPTTKPVEDENYDEEEEEDYDKVEELPQEFVPAAVSLSEARVQTYEVADIFDRPEDPADESEDDLDAEDLEPFEEFSSPKEAEYEASKSELPVLFHEYGKEVLRFSELFGTKQPFWMLGNKRLRSKRSLFKGRQGKFEAVLDDDEAEVLKTLPLNFDPQRMHSREHDDGEVDEIFDRKDEACVEMDKFLACEPLNSRLGELADVDNVFSANFDPVHQFDWEDGILWDGERPQDNSREQSEASELTDRQQRKSSIDTHVQNQIGSKGYLHKEGILLEPLSRQNLSTDGLSESSNRHPQMLRLDSWRQPTGNDLVKKLDRLNLESDSRNTDLTAGTWIDDVCWDHQDSRSKSRGSKIIFDFTDCHMVFEVSDAKETKGLREHAAAMIVSPRVKNRSTEAGEPTLPSRFNISNDKFYTIKKTPQQQKSQSKKRVVHGVKVVHSVPALKLQMMKPKLTNKDLANFHRPKASWFPHHNEMAAKEQGELAVKGPMKVILKTLGGKGSRLHVDASDTLEAFKIKAAKKLGDLKPSEKTKVIYSGRELEEAKAFSEQGVPPNSVLHLVRTKVHPWPKAQRLPGENKPTRPPGAFKRKSELSVKDGHVALIEYSEERPLLLSNVGMGAILSTYYRKMSPADSTAMTLREERGSWVGAVIPLEPAEESPFLGNIRLGETQSCLETNMYRAPAFQHKVGPTDFLLVRSAKGKISLRRIDSVHVVGQQEPHMEVIAPSSKTVLQYLGNRLLVHVYREFRAKDKPGVPAQIGADELMAQFPSLTDGFIRKRLKHCADLQRGPNGDMRWVMRRGFRIPSEEELRRMVTPENVCCYESMQAGTHHLKRMGVHKLTQQAGLGAAMNQLPDEALALAAASHIERELQLTPWNLSSNFVSATMQGRSGIERLDITGAGDPSGRGLGFSYLRVALRPPNTGAIIEKKAAAARGGGSVTGTDADLRRLSMDAAREVLLKFQVPEDEIERMTRWHRIALVRKLSSEQAATGVKMGAAALNKFARGQRMSFLQLQQQTREKCQDIWDRQVQSLYAIDGEESESEGEGNGDLDSFAGDLENLLEAEEGDGKDTTSKKEKKETIRGLGARRRALQAQLEEDMEDEEAEAAELHRMLMEDDEVEDDEKQKKLLNGNGSANRKDENSNVAVAVAATLPVEETNNGQPNPGKKKKKILKRIVRKKRPDGTITLEETIITDPKEVAKYLARKNAAKSGIQKVSFGKGAFEKKPAGKNWKEKKPGMMKNISNQKNVWNRGREAKEGLQVVCGACGQLGHMRTNKKKCPLYLDEAGTHTPRPEPEVIERPVPKITIKKKKIEELDNKAAEPLSEAKTPRLKLTRIKFRLPPSGHSESGPGSARSSSNNTPQSLERRQVTSNGHDGPVYKIKVVKKEKKIIVGPPDQEQGVLIGAEELFSKRQLELERERERTKLELEKEREKEKEREREHERQEAERRERDRQEELQAEQQRLRQLEFEEIEQREIERKRQIDTLDEEERKRKKQRIKEQKERQKVEEMEKRLQEEQYRIRRELEEMERRRDLEVQKQNRNWAKHQPEEQKKGIVIKTKLGSDKKNSKRREREPAGQFEAPELPKRQRKRGAAEVELSNILEVIVDQMRQADCSYLFLKPVTKKDAPDYHYYITTPMDLSTIRDRARRLYYKSREDFLVDVQQIVDNAHRYNENRNPGIPPLADRLLEVCERLLEERDLELTEAEGKMGEDDVAPLPGRKRSLRTL